MRVVDAGYVQAASGQTSVLRDEIRPSGVAERFTSPSQFFGTMNRQDTKGMMELAMMITPRVVRPALQETVGPMLLLPQHWDSIVTRTLKMDAQQRDTSVIKRWDAAHKCPRCCHALRLADFDLKTVTTGIVTCPNCDWSGPIDIEIIESGKPEV
jgi:hypothetical protein